MPGCCGRRRRHEGPISWHRRPEGRGKSLRTRTQTLLDGDLIHRHEHFGHGAEGTIEVYGNQAVKDAFDAHILVDRFKVHPIEGVVNFHVIHDGDSFSVNGWEITAVSADHDVREECLIYICKRAGKVVFYGHDTGAALSDAAWDLIKRERFDLVSLDATMGKKFSPSYHMGLPNAEETLRRLEELGCVDSRTVKVVSHFSHNGGMTHDELSAWGAKRGILAAYDGMEAVFRNPLDGCNFEIRRDPLGPAFLKRRRLRGSIITIRKEAVS